MTVALMGGPLDGALTKGLSHVPPYMVATNIPDKPVYRRAACDCCASKQETVVYKFAGYATDARDEEFGPVIS